MIKKEAISKISEALAKVQEAREVNGTNEGSNRIEFLIRIIKDIIAWFADLNKRRV